MTTNNAPDAAAMTTARETDVFIDEDGPEPPRNILIRALRDAGCDDGVGGDNMLADAILSALAEAGLVIVPVHSCPHCGTEWTIAVLVDAAVRCPNCYQPDERWTVTLAARPGEDGRDHD